MSAPHIAVLREAGASPLPWERAIVPAPTAMEVDAAATARVDCVLVDGTAPGAIDRLRRVRRRDPAIQTIVVAEGIAQEQVRRALLFSPGLGEVWVKPAAEVDLALVSRAAEVTRLRRVHEVQQRRLKHALSGLEPSLPRRAALSDAYLAALLEATPDPIISLDELGTVLSWNPAAEELLGRPAQAAVGRPLDEALRLVGGSVPSLAGAAAAGGPVRSEVRFRRANGEEGEGELLVSTVHSPGRQVFVAVLRDFTEERRIRADLEATATELEAQAAELEAQTEELQSQAVALTEALSARARFYSAMSHELRTPVNAILGYQSLLLDGIYAPLTETQRAALERAHRAARHLLELVGDVLDLAKIEAGRIELEHGPARFPDVLEDLVATVQPLAASMGSTLVIDQGPPHTITTDPRRVRQILLNLLSNAVKFGEGKPIELRWRPVDGGGVEIEVADHGAGIAPDDLPRLFDEFSQFGEARHGGTGLGLAISKRLSDVLGGEMSVESALGRGSMFRLRLPATLEPAGPELQR